ncbi:MAG: GntR family transcriptional regulator [Mesorhizobium amorphae]|nr:MAG: GntR family transcriptional regulator [Mesorhizobium amorphae]
MALVGTELLAQSADLPLYRRLVAAIEGPIRATQLRPGAVLPGERLIADELGLSRVTVRKAFAVLEEEGLLTRRHGFKTEVGARVEKSLSTLSSFSEDIRARGQEPGCIWISKQLARPFSHEMMALGITGSMNVVRMKRVRTADGVPIALEVATVPQPFLSGPDAVGHSLYEALAERGFMPQHALQRMQARAASEDDARHLECPAGSPVLVTERRCFLGDGRTVEFCETTYKGDVYDFVFELNR